ncbi:hypothetical protein VSR68_18245 [Paraburkholderia phymatum]|uniref:hypothetical protein n=1 Tax=Paraburkholderia phymatum TaxID=148447 RepID=UPI00317AC505
MIIAMLKIRFKRVCGGWCGAQDAARGGGFYRVFLVRCARQCFLSATLLVFLALPLAFANAVRVCDGFCFGLHGLLLASALAPRGAGVAPAPAFVCNGFSCGVFAFALASAYAPRGAGVAPVRGGTYFSLPPQRKVGKRKRAHTART